VADDLDWIVDDKTLRGQVIEGLAYRFYLMCKEARLTWREAAAAACSMVTHLAKKRPEDRAAFSGMLSSSLGRVRNMTAGVPDA
jgi:hypothetical protein